MLKKIRKGPTIGYTQENSLISKILLLNKGESFYLFNVSQGHAHSIVSVKNKQLKKKLKIKSELRYMLNPKDLKTEIVYKITKL